MGTHETRTVSPAVALADLSGRYVRAQEERQRITDEMRKIVESHEAEARSGRSTAFSAERRSQLGKLRAERNRIEDQIRAENYEARIAALSSVAGTDEPVSAGRRSAPASNETRTSPRGNADQRSISIRQGKRTIEMRFDRGSDQWNRISDEYREAFAQRLLHPDDRGTQSRAHVVSQGAQGGFLAPIAMSASIIEDLADDVHMRRLATLETVVGAASLGIVAAGYYTDAAQATEAAATTGDTGDIFGYRELTPRGMRKVVDISRRLIRQSSRDPEVIVSDRLREAIASTEEAAFVSGSGATGPLGVFTASANGITTARDVATGSTTGVTYGGVLNAFYNVKQGYRVNGTWMMHRDVLSRLHALVDGNGNALVRPDPMGIMSDIGTLDRILGRPVVESEFAPDTLTSENYAYVFGDFRRGYIIATSIDMELIVDPYSQSDSGLIRYTAEHYVDGQPVLPQAFSRGVFRA